MSMIGLLLGARLDDEMLWVGLVSGALIVVLIGLYVLKRRIGSQGWRVKVPYGVHRAIHFVIWFFFKKLPQVVPWKPILIWGPWVVIVFVTAYYLIENARGKKAWERTEAELRGRGEKLDLIDFEPVAIPDEENFVMHPAVRDEVNGVHHPEFGSLEDILFPSGATGPRRSGGSTGRSYSGFGRIVWVELRRGVRTDVRGWYSPARTESERVVAEELLANLAPVEARLDAIAEAAKRPGYSQAWDRSRSDPAHWEFSTTALPVLSISQAIRCRALLCLRTGDLEGAKKDFALMMRLAELLAKDQTNLGNLVTVACVQAAGDVLWELVQTPETDLARLSEALSFLRGYDARVAFFDGLKFERAWFLAVIEYGAGKRTNLSASFGHHGGGRGVIDILPDGAPDWLDEAQDFTSEWAFRLGPPGWFGIWKSAYCGYLDRTVFRPDGVDVNAIQPDTPARVQREEERLAPSFEGIMLWISVAASRFAERALFAQGRIELMLCAVELERFRREAGRYPGSLAELVPEYLAAVPIDFMSETGAPLFYRLKEDDTPLLYSVGANRKDDGGVPARRPDQLDWVWQMTPTEGQSEAQWSWGEKPRSKK